MPIRTTISTVVWTDTPEQAQEIVDDVKGVLPEEAREVTLARIEYATPPEPPEPLPVPPPPQD
jgi:hypothetical protein